MVDGVRNLESGVQLESELHPGCTPSLCRGQGALAKCEPGGVPMFGNLYQV